MASCHNKYSATVCTLTVPIASMDEAGFPLTPKQTFLRPKNASKTSKIVDIIANSNKYTSKILGQNASIRPLFGTLTETLRRRSTL